MSKRYQVRALAGGGWSVIDTDDRNMTVDTQRRKRDALEVARELNEPKWPSDAEENATRDLVALADSLRLIGDPEVSISATELLRIYLDVEAILMRHDVNPRKLRDAMDHLSRYGNE